MNCIPDIKNKKLIYNTDDEENLYSSNFENLNYERLLNIIRTDLYELIVRRNDENEYFALDDFASRNSCSLLLPRITAQIITELQEKGWNTKLSFGDTGLFIYSTEDKPRSCW